MKELFSKQLEKPFIMTSDILSNLHGTTYFNGDTVMVGDTVLFALQVVHTYIDSEFVETVHMDFIKLNPRHFELFYHYKDHGDTFLPILKLKE